MVVILNRFSHFVRKMRWFESSLKVNTPLFSNLSKSTFLLAPHTQYTTINSLSTCVDLILYPMSSDATTLPPILTDRPPPPPTSRRSRRHWMHVKAYHAKCKADVDALLPETWEGQVRKPVENLYAGSGGNVADTDTATNQADSASADNAGWCVVM